MKLRAALLGLALTVWSSSALPADVPARDRVKSCDPKVALAAANEIVQSPHSLKEPIEMFPAALALLQHGRKDDAVFWYYAAQLRGRQQVLFEKGDRPQILAMMMATVGSAINNYAFHDTKKLDRTFDRVLQWDRSTPNPYRERAKTPETEKQIDAIYRGFQDLRAKIAAQGPQLEKQARETAATVQKAYGAPAGCAPGQKQ